MSVPSSKDIRKRWERYWRFGTPRPSAIQVSADVGLLLVEEAKLKRAIHGLLETHSLNEAATLAEYKEGWLEARRRAIALAGPMAPQKEEP